MRLVRKLVILSHRYLGVALSLMVMMWFATGIAMLYVGGMPRLTAQLRLDRLPEADLSQVKLSAAEAAEAGLLSRFSRATMLTVMGRPAYRFSGPGTTTVFADTGEVFEGADPEQARATASQFMRVPLDRVHYVRTLDEVDQWTLVNSRQLPLHKVRIDDADATELYVQAETAEVAVLTTGKSRSFAWISTIPHFLYFTALRTNQPLWYQVVVWTSGLACVLAVLGLMLSFTQFRRTRPFNLAKSIPYSGPMRWHYVTGTVFGVFTLTFAFSGMLSMEPFAWTNATGLEVPRDTFTGGPLDLAQYPRMEPAAWANVMDGRPIKEVELLRIHDAPYLAVHTGNESDAGKRERLHQPYYITGRAEANRLMVRADTLAVRQEAFSNESLVDRLEAAIPGTPILASDTLGEYDSYYYSRGRQTPLPVLRVKFDDPAQTWVYIDPETSQVLSSINKMNRVERWLYNGLHSLDFAFWYDRRPLWDIVMIVLCVGGFSTSFLGLWMGLKRARRLARSVAVTTPTHLGTRADATGSAG
jgi:uncharacterized iron-regulated membrane protein